MMKNILILVIFIILIIHNFTKTTQKLESFSDDNFEEKHKKENYRRIKKVLCNRRFFFKEKNKRIFYSPEVAKEKCNEMGSKCAGFAILKHRENNKRYSGQEVIYYCDNQRDKHIENNKAFPFIDHNRWDLELKEYTIPVFDGCDRKKNVNVEKSVQKMKVGPLNLTSTKYEGIRDCTNEVCSIGEEHIQKRFIEHNGDTSCDTGPKQCCIDIKDKLHEEESYTKTEKQICTERLWIKDQTYTIENIKLTANNPARNDNLSRSTQRRGRVIQAYDSPNGKKKYKYMNFSTLKITYKNKKTFTGRTRRGKREYRTKKVPVYNYTWKFFKVESQRKLIRNAVNKYKKFGRKKIIEKIREIQKKGHVNGWTKISSKGVPNVWYRYNRGIVRNEEDAKKFCGGRSDCAGICTNKKNNKVSRYCRVPRRNYGYYKTKTNKHNDLHLKNYLANEYINGKMIKGGPYNVKYKKGPKPNSYERKFVNEGDNSDIELGISYIPETEKVCTEPDTPANMFKTYEGSKSINDFDIEYACEPNYKSDNNLEYIDVEPCDNNGENYKILSKCVPMNYPIFEFDQFELEPFENSSTGYEIDKGPTDNLDSTILKFDCFGKFGDKIKADGKAKSINLTAYNSDSLPYGCFIKNNQVSFNKKKTKKKCSNVNRCIKHVPTADDARRNIVSIDKLSTINQVGNNTNIMITYNMLRFLNENRGTFTIKYQNEDTFLREQLIRKSNFEKSKGKWIVYLPNYIKNIYKIVNDLEVKRNWKRIFDAIIGTIAFIGPDLIVIGLWKKFGRSWNRLITGARLSSKQKIVTEDTIKKMSSTKSLNNGSQFHRNLDHLSTFIKSKRRIFGKYFGEKFNAILETYANYLGKINIGTMSKNEFLNNFAFNSNFFKNKKFKNLPDEAKDFLLRHHGFATKNDLTIRIDSIKYKIQQYETQTTNMKNKLLKSKEGTLEEAKKYEKSRQEGLDKLKTKLNNAEILQKNTYNNPSMLDNNTNFLKGMSQINKIRKAEGKEPLNLYGKKDLNSYLHPSSPKERELAAKFNNKTPDGLLSQAARDYESFRTDWINKWGTVVKVISSVFGGVIAYTSRIWKNVISFNYGTTRGWLNYLEKKKFKRFDRFVKYVDRIVVSSGDAQILTEIAEKSKKFRELKKTDLSKVSDGRKRFIQKDILKLEEDIANLIRNPVNGGSGFKLKAIKANLGTKNFDKDNLVDWFKANNDMDNNFSIFHTMGFAKLEDSPIPLLNWWYEFKNFQFEWIWQRSNTRDWLDGGADKAAKYYNDMALNRQAIKNNILSNDVDVTNNIMGSYPNNLPVGSRENDLVFGRPYQKMENGSIDATPIYKAKMKKIRLNVENRREYKWKEDKFVLMDKYNNYLYQNPAIKNLEEAYFNFDVMPIKNKDGKIGLPPDLQDNYDELVKQLQIAKNNNELIEQLQRPKNYNDLVKQLQIAKKIGKKNIKNIDVTHMEKLKGYFKSIDVTQIEQLKGYIDDLVNWRKEIETDIQKIMNGPDIKIIDEFQMVKVIKAKDFDKNKMKFVDGYQDIFKKWENAKFGEFKILKRKQDKYLDKLSDDEAFSALKRNIEDSIDDNYNGMWNFRAHYSDLYNFFTGFHRGGTIDYFTRIHKIDNMPRNTQKQIDAADKAMREVNENLLKKIQGTMEGKIYTNFLYSLNDFENPFKGIASDKLSPNGTSSFQNSLGGVLDFVDPQLGSSVKNYDMLYHKLFNELFKAHTLTTEMNWKKNDLKFGFSIGPNYDGKSGYPTDARIFNYKNFGYNRIADLNLNESERKKQEISLKKHHIFGASHYKFDTYPLGIPVIIESIHKQLIITNNDIMDVEKAKKNPLEGMLDDNGEPIGNINGVYLNSNAHPNKKNNFTKTIGQENIFYINLVVNVEAKDLDYLVDGHKREGYDTNQNGLVFSIRRHIDGKYLVNDGTMLKFTEKFHPGINGFLIERHRDVNNFNDLYTIQSLNKHHKKIDRMDVYDTLLDLVFLDPISPIYRFINSLTSQTSNKPIRNDGSVTNPIHMVSSYLSPSSFQDKITWENEKDINSTWRITPLSDILAFFNFMDYANYTDMTNKNSTFFKTAKDEPFEIVKEFTNSDQKKLKLNASFKKKQDEYKKSGKILDYINIVLKNIGRKMGKYESRKAINQCWDGSNPNKFNEKITGKDCNIPGTVCDGTFGSGTCVARRKYGQLCDTSKNNFCETKNCQFYADTLQPNACRYKVNSRKEGETCGKHEECNGEMSCCGPQNKKDIGLGVCSFGVKDFIDMKYCPNECQGREGLNIPATCSLKDVDRLGYDGTCAFDVQCEEGKICLNNKCKHLLDNYVRTGIAQYGCTPKEAIEYAGIFNHDQFKDLDSGVTNYNKIIELEKRQNREGGGYRCKSGYSCHGICFPNPFKDTYKLYLKNGKVEQYGKRKYVQPKKDNHLEGKRKGAKYKKGWYCWDGEPHCRVGLDCTKFTDKVQDAKDTVDTMGKVGLLGKRNQKGPQAEQVKEAVEDVASDVSNAWKDWTCQEPIEPDEIGMKCEKNLFGKDPCKEGICIGGECKCDRMAHCKGKSDRWAKKKGWPTTKNYYYCKGPLTKNPNECWERKANGKSADIQGAGCENDYSCLSGKSYKGSCIHNCVTVGEKISAAYQKSKTEVKKGITTTANTAKKVIKASGHGGSGTDSAIDAIVDTAGGVLEAGLSWAR